MKSLQEIADFFAELGRPWVAVDEGGDIFSALEKPERQCHAWSTKHSQQYFICYASQTTYKGDWKDSLTKGTVPLKKGDKVRFNGKDCDFWYHGYYVRISGNCHECICAGEKTKVETMIWAVCEPYDWTESDLMPEWLKKEVEG
jgi:hypothetical protein